MRIDISLTPREFEYVRALAARRNHKEGRLGAMTYGGTRGGLEAHELGIVAEAGMAKLLNTRLDRRVFRLGDDGVDLQLPGAGMCAVKATTYWSQPLLRAEVEHHHSQIEVYVACCVRPGGEAAFFGWASGLEVALSPKRRLMAGGPMNYVMSEEELRSPDWLLDICLRAVAE